MSASVVFTSFNRIKFLKTAVDSFMTLNSYPIDEIIIIDDSAKPEAKEAIIKLYGDRDNFRLLFPPKTLGQPKAIDTAYELIDSDYVFHAEDDYLFEGNANFIQDSIDIMENDSRVNQVWCRHFSDYFVSHGDVNTMLDQELLMAPSGVEYKIVLKDQMGTGWCGFSWNPGLRKMSDYKTIFPDGYQACVREDDPSFVAEFRCSELADSHGYGAAILINGCCYNHGAGLSVHEDAESVK